MDETRARQFRECHDRSELSRSRLLADGTGEGSYGRGHTSTQGRKITMGLLLKADGTRTVVEPKNGSVFESDEIEELVGCDCWDKVPLGDGSALLIDDGGKLRGKPRNEAATEFVRNRAGLFPGDYIAGDALFATAEERGV